MNTEKSDPLQCGASSRFTVNSFTERIVFAE